MRQKLHLFMGISYNVLLACIIGFFMLGLIYPVVICSIVALILTMVDKLLENQEDHKFDNKNNQILPHLFDCKDSDPPTVKILSEVGKRWVEEQLIATSNGNRLFVRWIYKGVDDPAWNDWTFAAHVDEHHNIEWLEKKTPEYCKLIENAVYDGVLAGAIASDDNMLFVWWCLSNGDGPPGERVYDWLGHPDDVIN